MGIDRAELLGLVGSVLDVQTDGASGERLAGLLSAVRYYDSAPEAELHFVGLLHTLLPGTALRVAGVERVYQPALGAV